MAVSPRSPAPADINLLFGVLALQADLITNDQFAEACAAWTTRKGTPLAEILVERGWITAAGRADIERLLERKLKKHGGDVGASLAEAASIHIQRVLAILKDPDIERSLADLHQKGGHVLLNTVAYEPGVRERYTLTRLHATGGVGQVWLARDGDLGREVALKELRPERADIPSFWARFLEEAKITGQLEHPGIVPIYELSRRQEGQQPFYTMRFVRGRTLTEAARAYHGRLREDTAGPLELRELLGAFVGVCQAVAYAHSRGVIHRDLKGQNVVLGDYGEVMVLDWGLAKILGRAEEDANWPRVDLGSDEARAVTMQGQAFGTPAYMPPEQAEGRVDLVDERSDVYGLGAILYEVLTGRMPFDGADTDEVLKKVINEPPARPRVVNPQTPVALQAICLKAVAKKQSERYAQASELAHDVQRWLADEPVTAYREPLLARAGRWMRRHRTLATTAATLLLAAAVASTAGAILIGQKNVEIEWKRQEALNERDRAEGNFKLAREAVEKTLTGVAKNGRLEESDFHDLRKELLQAAVPFYEEFVKQKTDDPALEAERGDAFGRLAYLRAQMGELEAAKADYQRMREVYAKLVGKYPKLPAYRQFLARSHNSLGMLLDDQGMLVEAEEAYRAALTDQNALVKEHPKVPAYAEELALSQNNLGTLLGRIGKSRSAEEAYQRALAIQKALAAEYPKAPEYRQSLANSHNNLGVLLSDQGKPEAAEETYRAALAIKKSLAEEYPKVPAYRQELARSHNNLGVLLSDQDKNEAATELFRAALVIQKVLAEEYPKVPAYRHDLATSHNGLGVVMNAQRKREAAESEYRAALAYQKALVESYPKFTAYREELAQGQNNLANVLRDQGKLVAAENAYRAALDARLLLAAEYPRVPAYRQQLAKSHNSLGSYLLSQGKPAQAEEAFRAGMAIQKTLVEEYPKLPAYRQELGGSYYNLGFLLNDQEKKEAAEVAYREALAIRTVLVEENPRMVPYRQELASTCYNLGILLSESGRLLEAIGVLRKAGELGHAHATQLAKNSEHQLALVERLPAILERRDKPKDAKEQIEFAWLCTLSWQRQYVAATRFFVSAFAEDPKLADDTQQLNRYNAACAAALAGCGKGKDAGKLLDAEKAILRGQALEWLKTDLAFWVKQAAGAKPADQTLITMTLPHWLKDPDLAGVRADAIAKLPEAEQAAWRGLWQDVDAVLAKRKGPTK